MSDWPDLLICLRPEAGWLLLLWWLLVWLGRSRRRQLGGGGSGAGIPSPWARVIEPHLLRQLQEGSVAVADSPPSRWLAPGRAAALLGLLLILALAGPQLRWSGDPAKPLRPDVARVLVVDLSPAYGQLSEAEQQRLRAELRQFVRGLGAGETALLVTAGQAWLVVPPTEDLAALDGFLVELSPDVVPVQGDNPPAALALARRTLAATGARVQQILWLRAGALPVLSEGDAGQLGPGGIQPIFLQVNAGRGAEEWRRVVAAHDGGRIGEGWRSTSLNVLPVNDPDRIDLGPALILLALPLAVGLLRGSSVLGVLPLALLVGAAFPEQAKAGDLVFDQAVAEYRSGRYESSAAQFARVVPDDPRAHYNRGNALAWAGRLREALTAYDESLRLRPGDVSTLHNRALVARLLQSPPPPPSGGAVAPPPPAPAPQPVEAERAAAQWLRRPPAHQAGLLKRKLALEERRRNGQVAP